MKQATTTAPEFTPTKDQATILARLAEATDMQRFGFVPNFCKRDDYMPVNWCELMKGISTDWHFAIQRPLIEAKLVQVQPYGRNRKIIRITHAGYRMAVNLVATRAMEEGYTATEACELWNIYDVWA